MLVQVAVEPDAGGNDKITLFSFCTLLMGIGKLIQSTVQVDIEAHSQRMAYGQPPILAPHTQDEHGHYGFFADNGPEKCRPRDALPFLEASVEGLSQVTIPSSDFGSDCQHAWRQ